MLIAHITDFHIVPEPALCYGHSDTRAGLRRAVAALMAIRPRPDLVVASGDLVDEPSPEAYATLRGLLAPLDIPLVLIPGNHDDRALLAATFPEHTYLPPGGDLANFALDFDAVRLIGFDAVVAGKEYADPAPAALDWLAATLAAQPGRPTMMVMHHPPLRTGLAFMDAIQPPWPSRFTEILEANRQVKLIACGHVHRAIEGVLGGARVSSGGSTGHQFAFATDLDQAPQLSDEPAIIRLHLWHEGAVTSFTTPVGRDFTVRPFAGIDAAAWRQISAALRAGQRRPAGAVAEAEGDA
ncbi:phosphodiesterase [Azospirillum sp. B4]|uniref:phosphodiesterase n=1 Tax=Azospirillum sp. B4 TaxID=95605 RepID=UPI0003472F2B|nr:phosphodiesterase [Azospirillum sp. B4]